MMMRMLIFTVMICEEWVARSSPVGSGISNIWEEKLSLSVQAGELVKMDRLVTGCNMMSRNNHSNSAAWFKQPVLTCSM